MKANLPVIGICLGSQLLAAALGAPVRPGPRKEIGWYPIYLEPAASADTLFADAPSQFEGFHWHGDIFDLPKGATRLAHSDLTECQAFRYGSAHGLLFHMEVTQASITGMAQAFPEELAQAGGSAESLAAGTKRHLERLQSIGATVFRRWVDTVRSSQLSGARVRSCSSVDHSVPDRPERRDPDGRRTYCRWSRPAVETTVRRNGRQ